VVVSMIWTTRALTLPLYPTMSTEQVDYVCASLAGALRPAARAA
jgi:dTDP-4-amino-4,6-dideoxygalactose transaminase